MTSFKEFLKQYEGEGTPVADFAYDVAHDKKFPDANDYVTIRRYLECPPVSACDEALEAFDEVWTEYCPSDYVDVASLNGHQRETIAMLRDEFYCSPKQALTICDDICNDAFIWQKGDEATEGVRQLVELFTTNIYYRRFRCEVTKIEYSNTTLTIQTVEDASAYPATVEEERRVRKVAIHSWDSEEYRDCDV